MQPIKTWIWISVMAALLAVAAAIYLPARDSAHAAHALTEPSADADMNQPVDNYVKPSPFAVPDPKARRRPKPLVSINTPALPEPNSLSQ